jgi:glycosyltransferase involved in cell wall biosynthesis
MGGKAAGKQGWHLARGWLLTKMRVTHVLKAAGLSGAEAHIIALSQALRPHGYECDLAVLVEPQRLPQAVFDAARMADVPYISIPIGSDLDLSVISKISAHLRANKTQLVNTHMIHGDVYGTLAANRLGVAVVQSRHNQDRFRRWLPVQLLTRLMAASAKTIVGISDSVVAFTRDVEGIPGPKIARVYYGLDPAQVTQAAQPGRVRIELGLSDTIPLAACVGRLIEQKGITYLLEAWAQVLKKIPNAVLVIAGDGPLHESLKQQAGPLGESVCFLGWRLDIPNIMADCDVLVVPSLWEGFGLVTLEAMALKKPIVASRVGALPEIVVNNETGLLVEPAQAGALAEALSQLLGNPARAQTMGTAGKARLEKQFSVSQMAKQMAAVYKEAASRVPEFRA